MLMADNTANIDGEKKYRGVRQRKWGRWVSEIRLPNSRERIWLGSYDSPEKAARAFDAASVCLRGPHCANLNFPDSPPQVSVSCNSRNAHFIDPQEIQAAATSHANKARNSSMPVAHVPRSDNIASTLTLATTSITITGTATGETSNEPVVDYWHFMDNLLSPAGTRPLGFVEDFPYNQFISLAAVPPQEEADDPGEANFSFNSYLWNFN